MSKKLGYPKWRAASCVGDEHTIAEELADQTAVAVSAQPLRRNRELKKGFLNGTLTLCLTSGLLGDVVDCVIEDLLLGRLLTQVASWSEHLQGESNAVGQPVQSS